MIVLWARQIRSWTCCAGVVAFSFWAAWMLRFDLSLPAGEMHLFYRGLLIAVAVKASILCAFGVRLDRWSGYSGIADLVFLFKVNFVAWVAACVATYAVVGRAFPRSVCLLDLLACFLASGSLRFAARLWDEAHAGRHGDEVARGLLVYGAGVAGVALVREIRGNPKLGYRVLGFLDDDQRKHGAKLLGVPVLGSGDDAPSIVRANSGRRPPVQEIVVAMPSATGLQIRAAVRKGSEAGVPCRIVPGLGELISGKLQLRGMREISVTDLLERDPVQFDPEGVRRAIAGHPVMVTGAAGSIGSELCHQIARMSPRQLIAFDIGESELFRLESNLRNRYPGLPLAAEIGDIRDLRRVEEVIAQYGVKSIFHAAAYKHVPVMERHVCEAVRNNVIGTWNVVQAAWRLNVASFLMVSSDKAVNPSSIMGLTKRVGELIVTASRPPVGRGQATRFVCVRFGNVLVSNGSVVPIFQQQIASGGPVTVTHPEMCRYFMTVQEAVQLMLEAFILGKGSEIFVLDMGKPVRILELARKMITLAGLKPDEDIAIAFVGLRAGEKLFEELSRADEDILPTAHEKIMTFAGRQMAFHELAPLIAELQHLLARRDPEAVIAHLRLLVPEYDPMPQPIPAGVETAPSRMRIVVAGAQA